MNKDKIQTIVNEVKKSLPREKWSLAIKTRIRASNDEISRPEPENVKVDDYTRAIADRICEDHFSATNNKILVSQFIRRNGELKSVKLDVKTGKVSREFNKGTLIGALVAFKTSTEIRVGWSFYNKNHEVLPFTRKNAIRVAIIRGLIDGINYKWTTSGILIPNKVVSEIPDFVSRITKYYSTTPANLSYNTS